MPNYRLLTYKLLVYHSTKIGIIPASPTQGVACPNVTGLKQVPNYSGDKNHPGCLLKMQIPEFHAQKS